MFPEAGVAGLEAWLAAYHGGPARLVNRAGAIQAAVCLEIEGLYCDTGFDAYSLHLEGPNGLLPNLDLVNTIVKLADARSVPVRVAGVPSSALTRLLGRSKYLGQLVNIVGMLLRQASGYPRHISGPFLKYRIDAVTLRAAESQRRENEDFHRHKFKAFYETMEGTFRSLNNVLEHLHQSFAFYILPAPNRYISIANFLPLSGLLAGALLFKVQPRGCLSLTCPRQSTLYTRAG